MFRHAAFAAVFVLGLALGVWVGYGLRPVPPSGHALSLTLRSGDVHRVRRVIDGDTIVLENGVHVRYLGVNTPESGRFVKEPAPFSAEATRRNAALVEGRSVRLELPADPLDPHGRAIARVVPLDDSGRPAERDAGATLIAEGLARALPLGLSGPEYAALKKLQDEAQAARRGLWSLTPPAADTESVVATASGKAFHRPHCAALQRSSAETLRRFPAHADALAAGLRPCQSCKPDAPSAAQTPAELPSTAETEPQP